MYLPPGKFGFVSFARNCRRTPTPVRSRVALPCAYEKRRCAPAPVLLHKRRRSRSRAPAPARKTPAPLPHTVPAPSPKTKAGRGLCPVPPFCVPISQQAAFVGAPAVGWFSDAARAFWLRPASDCWPLCQLCGPLVTGHRAGRHPPCRLLAACALLAGAGLQRTGFVLLQKLPVGSQLIRGNAHGLAHYRPPFLPMFSVMCSITDISSCPSPCLTTAPVATSMVSFVTGLYASLSRL